LQVRFSRRIFCFAVLAVLTAGVVYAPHRIAAQGTGQSTAQANDRAQSASAPEKEAPKTEQEEMNVYRHAPIVQKIANIFGWNVEITARVFEGINFGIIFLAIAIPLSRYLPKLFRGRSQKVLSDIKSARKVTEDANTRLSAVEAKLASLGDEISKFRSEVEQEMGQDEQRIKATIEEESARIVAGVEQEIGAAAAHARRGLRNFAADLAIENASKQLVLTPETDQALIAEFVSAMSRDGAAKGGQN
jgi:F-type H+-transporting ATPase subunit b